MRLGFGAVRRGAAGLVDLREQRRRDDEQQENEEQAAHQTALPRMRSAARRASDSDSRDDLLARGGDVGAQLAVGFGDDLPRLGAGALDDLLAVRARLAAEAVAHLRGLALRGVELRLDLRGRFVEARQRVLVQLLGRPRLRLARFENLVDRLQEELAHDQVIQDEDHHDREQR